MAGVTVAIVLAVTGAAENLVAFFSIVGASFGPICGAMAADYLLSGRRWAGPRQGINVAGYGAWAVGFLIGILPFLPVSDEVKRLSQPAALYGFVAGFIVYFVLAKAGLQPKPVERSQRLHFGNSAGDPCADEAPLAQPAGLTEQAPKQDRGVQIDDHRPR